MSAVEAPGAVIGGVAMQDQPQTMTQAEIDLEAKILRAKEQQQAALNAAESFDRRRIEAQNTALSFMAQLRGLIAQRTPAQIERMEREKGLR